MAQQADTCDADLRHQQQEGTSDGPRSSDWTSQPPQPWSPSSTAAGARTASAFVCLGSCPPSSGCALLLSSISKAAAAASPLSLLSSGSQTASSLVRHVSMAALSGCASPCPSISSAAAASPLSSGPGKLSPTDESGEQAPPARLRLGRGNAIWVLSASDAADEGGGSDHAKALSGQIIALLAAVGGVDGTRPRVKAPPGLAGCAVLCPSGVDASSQLASETESQAVAVVFCELFGDAFGALSSRNTLSSRHPLRQSKVCSQVWRSSV